MTTSVLVLGLAAVGTALLGPHRTTRQDLLRDGEPTRSSRQPIEAVRPAQTTGVAPAVRIGAALAGCLTVALLMGGARGVVVGAVAAACLDRVLRRLEPAAVARLRARRAAELPIALDLLAVCLLAGAPLATAFEIVASALPGPLASDLRVVAAMQRLGATPRAAWADHADDPVLGPVAAAVARSAESGSRLAESFQRLAADHRHELAVAAETRAQRAGVLAMAPLGLCFLPAFICLGIVPLVLSLAGTVMGRL